MPIDNEQPSQTLLSLPEVEVESIANGPQKYLVFEFRNHFSLKAAEAAVNSWSDYNLQHEQSATHIWNCKRMSGFDMAAKKVWMNKMKESGDLIERIILVSEMILIRGAARLMSKFSKHDLQVYKSLDQMCEQENITWQTSMGD